jgi:hypothetical protein
VAEDILGLSPEVIAALLGVALGLFGERLMRAWGRLRCDSYGWEIRYVGERPRWEGEIPAEEAEYRAHGVEYRVSIDLFNGKEVPTGLRDI